MRELDLSEKLHPPRRLLSRISARQEPARGAARRRATRTSPRRRAERVARALRAASSSAAGALDFDDLLLRAVALLRGQRRRCARPTGERFQLRAGRRVPGHEPHAVRPGAPAGGRARQPDRGGRRGPVDLLLARRRHPQHPRLRARLPGRARAAAGGELPLHPGHPGRGLRPGRAQPRAQGQDPARGQGRAARRCACTSAGDEFQEAAFVVEKIAAGRGGGRRAAVLFRTNAQSRLFEEALLRARHPLPGGGRRRVLRAQGGEGRARLPAPGPEPARPPGAAPRAQRARARASASARWRRSRRVAARARR